MHPSVDEQAAAIPPLAHALCQLASHAVSVRAVDALLLASHRAKREIEAYEARVTHVSMDPDAPYEYFVIERRRAMVECNFALGHIGQVAAARDDEQVCAAACTALLQCACRNVEPGCMYKSYMTSLRVTHSAICNLIRLGSTPNSCAAASGASSR